MGCTRRQGERTRDERLGRLVGLAALGLGLLLAPVASAATGASADAPSPQAAATTTVPPTLSSSSSPTAAVQTGAGKVRVTGPVTPGATKLRLVEDGAVVIEVKVTGNGIRSFERKSVAAGAHTYALQAGNGAGWASASSTKSVTVVAAPAAPSTPVLAEVSDTVMSVTFSRVTDAASYNIAVNGKPRAQSTPKAGAGSVVVKLDRLVIGTSYSVTVSAANVAGSGPASAAATMTLYAQMKAPAMPAVGNGTAQTGAGAAHVVAKVTPGAASYTLMIDDVASAATPTTTAKTAAFDVSSLSAGTHRFAVRVANARYTTTSKPLSLDILPAPSAASAVSVAQTADTAARVSFTPGASSTLARVYLDGALAGQVKISKGATTAGLNLTSLVALSSHHVTVVSSNVVGNSAATSPLAFTLYPVLPATVGQPVATQTIAESLTITIGTTPNATSYALMQDNVSVQETTASAGSVTFTVADLQAGSRYSFQVVAKNPRMSAPPSRFVSAFVYPVLTTAPDVVATTRYDPGDVAVVAVAFTSVAGADGYRIYVDGVLTSTRLAPTLTFTAGSATVSLNMDSTTSHTVEVSADNVMGAGPRSTAADIDPAP